MRTFIIQYKCVYIPMKVTIIYFVLENMRNELLPITIMFLIYFDPVFKKRLYSEIYKPLFKCPKYVPKSSFFQDLFQERNKEYYAFDINNYNAN